MRTTRDSSIQQVLTGSDVRFEQPREGVAYRGVVIDRVPASLRRCTGARDRAVLVVQEGQLHYQARRALRLVDGQVQEPVVIILAGPDQGVSAGT